MAKKLGYKPSVGKTGPGSVKGQKLGRKAVTEKETARDMHVQGEVKKMAERMFALRGKKRGVQGMY